MLIAGLTGCVAPFDTQSTRFGEADRSQHYTTQSHYGGYYHKAASYQPRHQQPHTPPAYIYQAPLPKVTIICCTTQNSVYAASPDRSQPSSNIQLRARTLVQRQTSQTATPKPPLEPNTAKPKTYVRLNGPTSVSDWTSCQAQAGDYSSGTFDTCMRGKGYVTEAEAISILEAGETDEGLAPGD